MDIGTKLQRHINRIKDTDRNNRRNGVTDLSTELFTFPPNEIADFLKVTLLRPLLGAVADANDRVKELACDLLEKIIRTEEIMSLCIDQIAFILPSIIARMNQVPPPEQWEEVRLKLLQITQLLLQTNADVFNPLMSDLCNMLTKCLADAFPGAKHETFNLISMISKHSQLKLGWHAGGIVNAIIPNLHHQHEKVRNRAVDCLRDVLITDGGSQFYSEAEKALKGARFDRKTSVRNTVYNLFAECLQMFPREGLKDSEVSLVYLLLSGQVDDELEIGGANFQLAAQRLFDIEHEKFEDDSQATFSTEVEEGETTLPEIPQQYLVTRNLTGLVKRALDDLNEITVNIQFKIRAAGTIAQIVTFSQGEITPHVAPIIKTSVRMFMEDEAISHLLESAFAEIGHWVPLSLLVELFRQSMDRDMISTTNRSVSLRLLTQTLVHAEIEDLEGLILLISDQKLVKQEDAMLLQNLKLTHAAVMNKAGTDCAEFRETIFYVLLSFMSSDGDKSLFDTLAGCCGFASTDLLFAEEFPNLFPKVMQRHAAWDASTVERNLYLTLIINSGEAIVPYLGTIIEIMGNCCLRDRDPELKLDSLVILEQLLMKPDLWPHLKPLSRHILVDVIKAAASWKAGAAHMKIRKASMLCLNTSLKAQIYTHEDFSNNWEEVFAPVKSCLDEDWDEEVRFRTCDVFEALLINYGDKLEFQYQDIYKEMISRLDDSKDYIRMEICKSFEVLFKLYVEKGHASNYEYMLDVLFVHLDDNNQEMRSRISEVLMVGMHIKPVIFLEKARSFENVNKHTREVTELIQAAISIPIDSPAKSSS